ncbi:MAG: tRNA adenosine(34) deaminase TadA [Myxococcaceae bacterium]
MPHPTQGEVDEAHMRRALELAGDASALGEVPVGAVIVREGQRIAETFNRRESARDPLAHAEILAIAEAARVRDAWRLSDVTLYVTLEPCAMCAGAIIQSRIARVVFGASDPKAGAVGSLYNLLADARHNHRPEVLGGVLSAECGQRLSDFFAARRA